MKSLRPRVLCIPAGWLLATASLAQGEVTLPAVRITAPHGGSNSIVADTDGATAPPVSLRTIGAATLQRPGTRTLASALQEDPAVGENYAATGYYENFTIRGFTLDLGSSYRVNGLVVPGELQFALRDKQAIEVLHGSGNLSGGLVSPAGTINALTKRSANMSAATFEVNSWGGTGASVDLGRAATREHALGWRLNLGHDDLHPAEYKARGNQDFLSLAADLQPSANWRLEADVDYGLTTQRAVPGFQLLGGLVAPEVDARTNINVQPWSRPVRNEGRLLSLRSEHALTSETRLRLGWSDAQARIDDNLAFPDGCNSAPSQYFCADGSYVLYDYRALERRRTTHGVAAIEGRHQGSSIRHTWRLGAESIRRRIQQHQLSSTTIYDDMGLAMSGNLASVETPLPAPPAAAQNQPARLATQAAVFIADQLAWGDWRLDLGLRTVRIDQQPDGTASTHNLPQVALSWRPTSTDTLLVDIARGMEFGDQAPLLAQNAGVLMRPRSARQLELGWRHGGHDVGQLGITAFRVQRPFEFTERTGTSWAGLGNYLQRGDETHSGIEVAARTPASKAFEMGASATLMHALAANTGDPAYEDKQIQNVPRARSSAWLAFTPRALPAARAELRRIHAGPRNARADGQAQVAGYSRYDASMSWVLRKAPARLLLQAAIENLANARYWRDVGQAYGADLLFPGRPRTVSVALTVEML